ncbi:MAG: PaaI family thioesterase [Lachnospiraceae bacterium]|jgi:acyl-CoA thioesterase|nr:PaaI family thioesterase [Lachnospiraceae bacterium]MCI1726822.1 PaaI family thioesterase [Lachnospiraceae bacterium]
MTDEELALEYFRKDFFAVETCGIHLEKVSEGYAKVSLPIGSRLQNATGHVMGGAIFTMADFAFAVAANYSRPVTVTLSSQISYLSAAKGSVLYAETRCIKDGKHACFYEADITDDLGNKVAKVLSNGYRMDRRFKNPEDAGVFREDPYREQKA